MDSSSTSNKMSSSSSTLLAPGFRFHPTDEELIRYYLRRKVCGKSFRFDAISEIDIYKAEPWDLPGFSKLKTRDLEWYFFSVLDKKYGNGARTNRATEKGYWKTTGKDRAVHHKSQIVGMKKTLVYHNGRAPKGQRTNWVMHEYRLTDLELQKGGIAQDAFVLCRVFQKSGSGPKNGEQYGAPFVEEEWEDDELEFIPKEDAAEEMDFSDDAYLDIHDLEQILGTDIPSDVTPLPLNFYSEGDGSCGKETAESVSDTQTLLMGVSDHQFEPGQHDDQKFYLPAQNDMGKNQVQHEYVGESSKTLNSEDLDYLLAEPFMDASDNLLYGDEGFIETIDLSNPIEADTSGLDMLEEYLAYFDANEDDSQYFAYDHSKLMGSEEVVSDQAFLSQKNEGSQRASMSSGWLLDDNNDGDVSSFKQELAKFQKFPAASQNPYVKHASRMLGNIPAPPAFASEFPPKDAVLRLNSTSQSSTSVHITTGMIQIRNSTVNGTMTDRSSGKQNFNIVLRFGLSQGEDGSASLESSISILPEKTSAAISWGWFFFMFFWVLILAMSFKIGTCICAK